ncbi:MAG TPA: Rieske 2Fe-2S domain-containing protein [Candidatus Sulfomarinibacteraceae bacterium]|nr:Rieske 2Fe-2S domain-containing protein [Candidatus Sulfomarinibacteraceae bacterium]
MINRKVDQLLAQLPYLEEGGRQVAGTLHNAVLQGGVQTRTAADILHGIWLGHPLHPLLTDVTIGAWTLGSLADLLSLAGGSKQMEKSADFLTAVGTASAIPTALSGLTDFSTIPRPATRAGAAHGLLNAAALIFYTLSLSARKRQNRGDARFFSFLGLMTATASAYLGGHLVYDKNVGVKHGGEVVEPTAWKRVMAESDLPEEEPMRVEVADHPVLLYRNNGRILAVGAVCPHAGGPLEEGEVREDKVQCPWHDSVFDLTDGCVVHGPSAYALPHYETRVREGQLEVRLTNPA